MKGCINGINGFNWINIYNVLQNKKVLIEEKTLKCRIFMHVCVTTVQCAQYNKLEDQGATRPSF